MPETPSNDRIYNGGLFPVWITLREPVKSAKSISWSYGSSKMAYRKQAVNASTSLITADTAFLYWDEPPPPFIVIDSANGANDTTYFYRDTIFAIVNDVWSLPIVIEIKNILPRIKKITVGGLDQFDDSLFTIAAHPGDRMEISIHLEKPFNNAFHPDVEMPKKMSGLKTKSRNDTLWVYEWTVPNAIIADSSLYLKIEDSRGRGERLYKIYLIVYTEFGSVWVASKEEIVKYSPTGTEVAKISDDFNSISDIAVNSNNGWLFITDQLGNSFFIYDTYGKKLYQNNELFKAPTSVAVDVVDGSIWVADAEGLHRFEFNGGELNSTESYKKPGQIRGISVNQYGGSSGGNFVWFTIPQSDSLYLIKDPTGPALISNNVCASNNAWNRPSMVSHDPKSGMAWVVDSSGIVAINAAQNILACINGFDFVRSVSASNGNVWATDVSKVYRFDGPFKGVAGAAEKLTVKNGKQIDGFSSPVSISAIVADGGAWVVDREAGMVVRLDNTGKKIAFGTGLTLPILGKTLQKVE